MRYFLYLFIAISTECLGGCAIVPSLPPDVDYPINEITRYTACELSSAYRYLYMHRLDFPTFHADQYAVTVQLLPKADLEFNARAGLTDKSSLIAKTFSSGALGSAPGGGAPGAGVDTYGHQDASVYYIANSADLISTKASLDCEHWSPAQPQLLQNLELAKWILRIARPADQPLGPFVEDKHSYTAEITIQWDAGGLFTYNFPVGSAFATGSGRYKIDESLLVTTVRSEIKPTKVATLPATNKFGLQTNNLPSTVSSATRQRLDILQLQQSIQNLQITGPRQ